jgi:hypothetical protein
VGRRGKQLRLSLARWSEVRRIAAAVLQPALSDVIGGRRLLALVDRTVTLSGAEIGRGI